MRIIAAKTPNLYILDCCFAILTLSLTKYIMHTVKGTCGKAFYIRKQLVLMNESGSFSCEVDDAGVE